MNNKKIFINLTKVNKTYTRIYKYINTEKNINLFNRLRKYNCDIIILVKNTKIKKKENQEKLDELIDSLAKDNIFIVWYKKYDTIKDKLKNIIEQKWYNKDNIFINAFWDKLVYKYLKLREDLWIVNSDNIKLFNDKSIQRKIFRKSSISVKYKKVKMENLDKAVEKIGFPCVIKPIWEAWSRWVYIIRNKKQYIEKITPIKEELKNNVRKNLFVVEEYIKWDMYSIDYFVDKDWNFQYTHPIRVKLGIKFKWLWKKAPFLNVISWFFGINSKLTKEKIENFIIETVKTAWIKNMFIHQELKIDKNWNLKFIEINGRIGWYRLNIFNNIYDNFHIIDFIYNKNKIDIDSKLNWNCYWEIKLFPTRTWKIIWLNEKKLDKIPSYVWGNVKIIYKYMDYDLEKDWYKIVWTIKFKNKDKQQFIEDVKTIRKKYKSLITLKKHNNG